MKPVAFEPLRIDPLEASRRRQLVVTVLLLLTGPAVVTMADLHWRTGYDGWKLLHLLLFTVLFVLVALGAAQSLFGFFLRRRSDDPYRIEASLGPGAQAPKTADQPADLSAEALAKAEAPAESEPVLARTAVVMPICNEEVGRVVDGLRVMYESVLRAGSLPNSDFFLLSDSTNPNRWIEEEAEWLALTQQLGAQGRIFYRKRRLGINKKAGNLADFCRRWGKLYRYMVVLDADSIMTGDAIVRLVRLMERNPRVGIIQGVPCLVNGETVLARLQQFASRIYGPASAAGLNYWQLGEANYWGHNAIIRLAPFIRHCSLPELPGGGPFGGRIMSHDYVEAALMRRAGWQVRLATELSGNYEECPPNLIALAQRDRRWLQGNLQHARLIVARGFHGTNRVHFALGILAYLASPLWLVFLAVSAVIAARFAATGLTIRPVPSFADYLHWSYRLQAFCLFGYTIALLLLPKALALIDLGSHPDELAAFGGWRATIAGVLLETLIFTLLAPVLMLYHTWFILLTLGGKSTSWGAQRRGRAGESAWVETVASHWVQTVLGLAGAILVLRIDPVLAAWMSPILAGLILSIPLSYFTGSRPMGQEFRRLGIFGTPEENRPLPELTQLAEATARRGQGPPPATELAAYYGFLQAVLDPYVNAAHVLLLRAKDDPPPVNQERFVALRATLLREGPNALSPQDRLALLLDVDSMHRLHNDVWATPASRLAEWWRSALKHYIRIAPAPQTAFSRPSAPSEV